MGRTRSSITFPIPKEKKPLSSTEQSRKHRLDFSRHEDDNLKRQIAHQLKAKNNRLSVEELEKKREDDRPRKAKSRLNQSRQKKVAAKLKDRNCKLDQKAFEDTVPSSTE